jgi:hypothetical protein
VTEKKEFCVRRESDYCPELTVTAVFDMTENNTGMIWPQYQSNVDKRENLLLRADLSSERDSNRAYWRSSQSAMSQDVTERQSFPRAITISSSFQFLMHPILLRLSWFVPHRSSDVPNKRTMVDVSFWRQLQDDGNWSLLLFGGQLQIWNWFHERSSPGVTFFERISLILNFTIYDSRLLGTIHDWPDPVSGSWLGEVLQSFMSFLHFTTQ